LRSKYDLETGSNLRQRRWYSGHTSAVNRLFPLSVSSQGASMTGQCRLWIYSPFLRLYWFHVSRTTEPEAGCHSLQGMSGKHPGAGGMCAGPADRRQVPALRGTSALPARRGVPGAAVAPFYPDGAMRACSNLRYWSSGLSCTRQGSTALEASRWPPEPRPANCASPAM
jgi:hypothetical protein